MFLVNFILVCINSVYIIFHKTLKLVTPTFQLRHANNAIHDCGACNVSTLSANDIFISTRPMKNVS
jgi:hypothetical protein